MMTCRAFAFLTLLLTFILFGEIRMSAQEEGIVDVHTIIRDAHSGQGIPYASIYIKERQSGATANEHGEVLLHLPPGTYGVIVRSLGYASLHATMSVERSGARYAYDLSPLSYRLDSVVVTRRKGDEDPAYAIMRRVMRRTPIYDKMIRRQVYRTYTKGSGKLEKVPFFIRNVKDEGIALKEYVGKRFVIEGDLGTEYDAPSTYKHHTYALRSSVPEQLQISAGSGLQTFANFNVYGKEIGMGSVGMITNPLRAGGLNVYTYKLISATTDGDETIYRIAYSSRRAKLAWGELFVSDRSWAPTRLTLHSDLQGIVRFDVETVLNPVQDEVHLPTSYILKMKNSLMGLVVSFDFYSSIKYSEVALDSSVRDLYRDEEGRAKREMPSEALFAPLKSSVARNITKTTRRLEHHLDTLGTKARDKYELPVLHTVKKSSVDSLALLRDSAYWKGISTMPLSEEELLSYAKKDSLMKAFDRKRALAPKKEGQRTGTSPLGAFIWGYDHKLGKHWTVGVGGLLGATLNNYRYCDGWWLGPEWYLGYDNMDTASPVAFELKPSLRYTTHSHRWFWQVRGLLQYAGRRRGELSVKAGHHSDDLGGGPMDGLPGIANMIFTLNDGRGNNLFYDRRYFSFTNRIDLANGVRLSIGGEHRESDFLPDARLWGIRKELVKDHLNHFAARDTRPMKYYEMERHVSRTVEVGLTFNTNPYYSMVRGRKVVSNESDRPLSPRSSKVISISTHPPTEIDNHTFVSLTYRQSIAREGSNDSDYSFLRASLFGVRRLAPTIPLLYRLDVGIYPHRRVMHADDGYYLKRENLFFLGADKSLFQTMRTYTTAGRLFTTVHLEAPLPLLFSHLPGKAGAFTQENLSIKTYWDYDRPKHPFLEAGYTVSFGPATLGVFYGGYNFKEYKGLSFRLGIGL